MKALPALFVAGILACDRAPTPENAEHSPRPDSLNAVSPAPGPITGLDKTPHDRAESTSAAIAVAATVNSPLEPVSDVDMTMLRSELIIPVSGVLAGELRDTFTEARGEGRRHDAIDIPAPRGTPVLSAGTGRVLKLFTSKAGGLMVYAADSSERFILMYGHLDSYAPGLADGSRVARGQTIGFVGTTGNAPPNVPHLHFAIARSTDVTRWWTGTAVNPYPLLKPR